MYFNLCKYIIFSTVFIATIQGNFFIKLFGKKSTAHPISKTTSQNEIKSNEQKKSQKLDSVRVTEIKPEAYHDSPKVSRASNSIKHWMQMVPNFPIWAFKKKLKRKNEHFFVLKPEILQEMKVEVICQHCKEDVTSGCVLSPVSFTAAPPALPSDKSVNSNLKGKNVQSESLPKPECSSSKLKFFLQNEALYHTICYLKKKYDIEMYNALINSTSFMGVAPLFANENELLLLKGQHDILEVDNEFRRCYQYRMIYLFGQNDSAQQVKLVSDYFDEKFTKGELLLTYKGLANAIMYKEQHLCMYKAIEKIMSIIAGHNNEQKLPEYYYLLRNFKGKKYLSNFCTKAVETYFEELSPKDFENHNNLGFLHFYFEVVPYPEIMNAIVTLEQPIKIFIDNLEKNKYGEKITTHRAIELKIDFQKLLMRAKLIPQAELPKFAEKEFLPKSVILNKMKRAEERNKQLYG